MSDITWLKNYDSELFEQISKIFGEESSGYYDDSLNDKLALLQMKGFYFNAITAGDKGAPDWLTPKHRFGVMLVEGKTTRSSSALTNQVYEKALNDTPAGGKMHTILYFKHVDVEFQSLFSLGNLNKHRAMGAQVIVGSPTTGFLKAITDFVSRFAGRNDIFQLDKGTFADGVATLEKHVPETYSQPS